MTIDNVKVTGNIQISTEGIYAAGIIGSAKGSKITNCSVIGEDGSYIKSNRWVGGISGYDNGACKMTGCHVENLDLVANAYAGGLAGCGAAGANFNGNTVTDVALTVNSAEAEDAMTYGTGIGGMALYSYSTKPITVYGNTYNNVTCTVNGAAVETQEMGRAYPTYPESEGKLPLDQGLVMMPSVKIGDTYYTYLQNATKAASKTEQTVIELTGDTMITAKFKPSVAKNQNIVLKTNGFNLIWVEQDADMMPVYNEDGSLKTVIVTAENVSSYIKIASGGSLVIE